MQKTSGLGRGLGSLIPMKKDKISSVTSQKMVDEVLHDQEQIMLLPVECLFPNPHQPRHHFDEESLEELKASIGEHGIIQPLIVSPLSEDSWQIIAGERRWRAAKSLGLETVPAIIRQLNEQKRLEIALIENLQRKDLNPLEVATAYQKLIDQFNLTQEQLAKRVGKNRSTVANTLRLLNVPLPVKEAITSGKISEGHARVIAGLPAEDQLPFLDQIVNKKMNVREAEKGGRHIVVQKHVRNLVFDPDVKAKEDELQELLGTKVEIKKHGGAGQIIIRFYSEEELQSLFKRIIS